MGVDRSSINDLKELESAFKKIQKDKEDMFRTIARQVALRFLMYVIPDTPTQENKKIVITGPSFSKTYDIRGGALKRGWIGQETPGGEPSASEIKAYADTLPVQVSGKRRSVTVSNNVEYAPYVNYGHRQKVGRYVPVLGKTLTSSWVDGQYMLENATKNVQSMAQGLVNKLALQWMRKYFE